MEDNEYYRAVARIDLGAIRDNFLALKAQLRQGVRAMAVVKADAYGHGALKVGRALSPLADYLAVADIYEAKELRDGGISSPILILSYTHPVYFPSLIRLGLTATLYSLSDAEALSQCALSLGAVARVHIAVDTGMGRIGLPCNRAGVELAAEICNRQGIYAEGIFSHLATADEADTRVALSQCACFDRFVLDLEEQGINIPIKHISGSAATLSLDRGYGMCRLGIALYGINPLSYSVPDVSLRPAMEIISRIIHVKTVPEGTKIGYGHTYVAPSERRIATVSIGYADGFRRSLGNKGFVLIKGKRVPVVGRVCMDQIMVDVTDIQGVTVGEKAVILGASAGECISAGELGCLTDSFPYEILCGFSRRVRRVYIGGDGV